MWPEQCLDIWAPDTRVGLHPCGAMGGLKALLARLLDVQHNTDAHTCSAPDGGPRGVVRALLGRLLAVGTTAARSGWSTPISLSTPSSSMIRKGDLQQAGLGIGSGRHRLHGCPLQMFQAEVQGIDTGRQA